MIAASKFSGGGGVDIGMEAAGWKHLYGIEYDNKIAQVARSNGLNTITADILKIKPDDYLGMDWMHDSPPCPNFSTAKANAEETENDIALAQAVCDWIVYNRPRFYTLENVYGYRKSKSWAMIADTLHRHGYLFNYWHVNMADYGVPQTRKRMIVIARRDGIMPQLPPQTHAENPVPGLFGTKKRWVSWYDAIEDLIPSLPDSQFASWQLERLPDEYKTILIKNGDEFSVMPDETKPCYTVSSSTCSFGKAFIVDSDSKCGTRTENEDSFSVVASRFTMPQAFICDGQANSDGQSMTTRTNEPLFTVTATTTVKRVVNALTNGRVVKMTPRALARFQSFPDWYELPESNTLAARIIGNAVPPLFMQRVGEMFADSVAV